MRKEDHLDRFIQAQENNYAIALSEIKQGRKSSHWMWYIFPQVQGLGFSATSKLYAIRDLEEAQEFLRHPVLGSRLVNICHALLAVPGNNATAIFGNPDDIKLRSSMTLFSSVAGADPVFHAVLQKFFRGKKDDKTLQKIHPA